MKVVQKFAVWLAAAALLLALAVATSFWAFRQMEQSAQARKLGFLEIQSAAALLAQLSDAETGQRGYLLTNDEAFLQSYSAVQGNIAAHLETLRQVSMAAASQKHLEAVAPLVDAKLAEMAKTISLRRSHGTVAALELVQNGQGKRLMDAIRFEMAQFLQIEEAALAQHDAQFQVNLRRLFTILVAASLLALLSALAFAYLIYQSSQQRLKNLVHQETEHLLHLQQQTNATLEQTNTALQEGKERLAVTLNSMGDAVVATDARACVTLLNPVAEQLTGWTLAQASGLKVDAIFHIINKETRLPAVIPVMDALTHGTVQGLANHTVLIARDGREFDIADSCAPIRDSANQVIGTILVFRDVTEEYAVQHALTQQDDELRQSRLALDASRARYFDLYDMAPVGYCTLDAHNMILEANLTASDLLGVKRGALVGQTLLHFISNEGIDGFSALSQQALESGEAQTCEIQMRKASGSQLWVHLDLTLSRAEGALTIRVVISDVSERKHAEAELINAGALQSAIFNSANFSSIATDAHGVIQIFNVGAERMLGYAAADVMNKTTPADISDPQEVITRAKTLSAELETTIAPGFEALVFKASRGIEDIYELTYIRKDGSRFPAVVSVTALRDAQDAIIGYLLIGTDNTARKRVEAERVLVEQALQEKNVELEIARTLADKANLAKSDFLSSMSHELRTPLGAILGFAQLIESGAPRPTPAQKRSVDQILKAGWYLLELINEVLDLALIESGRLSMSLEPVSLGEVLNECETMIEPQAQQRGIHLDFVPITVPYHLYADHTRVKQVLINLLSNAIKYNKLGGSVQVECTQPNPEVIRLSVRDTGAGLAPALLEQLFQPFNRLGQKGKVEEGTGIGLVVCKRLVELMQGRIGVESTVGEGSVFWFELRLTTQALVIQSVAAMATQALTPLPGEAPKHTLLYVEDNPANLMLVEDLMKRRPDIRLLSAMDGNTGIELARASLPNVILMDINLPGISGLKALSILARDPATTHIPVIAISANAIPRDIEKGLEAGFFHYLTKPIKINEFMEALDKALQFAATHPANATLKEST
jgi:PAS domain S-box-containing protein